jgi:hypothetical protein
MFSKAYGEAASMIAAIWIGLILGVSFFAAPIKFTAVGVSLEQLLAVGKVTFQAFSWIELSAFVLLVCASLRNLTRGVVAGILLLFLLLLIQKFGILPGLDTELNRTVAGETVEETNLHFVYIAIDCVKLAVLFFLSLILRNERVAP